MGNKIKSINFNELLGVMEHDEAFITDCFIDFIDIYTDFLDPINRAIQTKETDLIVKATENFRKILMIISADRALDLVLNIQHLCVHGRKKHLANVYLELCVECDLLRHLMGSYVCRIQKNNPGRMIARKEFLQN